MVLIEFVPSPRALVVEGVFGESLVSSLVNVALTLFLLFVLVVYDLQFLSALPFCRIVLVSLVILAVAAKIDLFLLHFFLVNILENKRTPIRTVSDVLLDALYLLHQIEFVLLSQVSEVYLQRQIEGLLLIEEMPSCSRHRGGLIQQGMRHLGLCTLLEVLVEP